MTSHEGVGQGKESHFHLLLGQLNVRNKEVRASNTQIDNLAMVTMEEGTKSLRSPF